MAAQCTALGVDKKHGTGFCLLLLMAAGLRMVSYGELHPKKNLLGRHNPDWIGKRDFVILLRT